MNHAVYFNVMTKLAKGSALFEYAVAPNVNDTANAILKAAGKGETT